MKIYGIQKLTLLDFPEHIACTIFTNGCDFRCPFCHNYSLACGLEKEIMDEDTFFDFLKTKKGKIDGIAISGGEPCINQDLPLFLEKAHKLGFKTKLDTNGYHPKTLAYIIKNNLIDYIAMDIKNSPEKYAITTGINTIDINKINESIRTIMASPIAYEFRTTIIDELHDQSDITQITKWIKNAKQYYLQAFVDRTSVPNHTFHTPSPQKLKRFIEIIGNNIQNVNIRPA